MLKQITAWILGFFGFTNSSVEAEIIEKNKGALVPTTVLEITNLADETLRRLDIVIEKNERLNRRATQLAEQSRRLRQKYNNN